MIDKQFAQDFAEKWIAAFNSHDLDRIFDLYTDDFTMTSPYIRERMGIEAGVLKGKDAVRPYWTMGLAAQPPLEFHLIGVFVGIDTVVVHYDSIGRKKACETFTFDAQGKVTSGCAQYISA